MALKISLTPIWFNGYNGGWYGDSLQGRKKTTFTTGEREYCGYTSNDKVYKSYCVAFTAPKGYYGRISKVSAGSIKFTKAYNTGTAQMAMTWRCFVNPPDKATAYEPGTTVATGRVSIPETSGTAVSGSWESGSSTATIDTRQGQVTYYLQIVRRDNIDGARYAGYTTWPKLEFEIESEQWTISYNANGGSGAPTSHSVDYGTKGTISSTKPTRSGYTFSGWALSADGAVQYKPGDESQANKNITLYAKWSKSSVSVTFRANMEDFDIIGMQANTTYTTPSSIPKWTHTEYGQRIFDGWYNKYPISNGIKVIDKDNKAVSGQLVPASDHKLYAGWISAYKLVYHANGGKEAPPNSDLCPSDTPTTISTIVPKRENYDFLGWSLLPEGSADLFQPGDQYPGNVNTEIRLYAQWKKLNVKVTFRANGKDFAKVLMKIGDKYSAPQTQTGNNIPIWSLNNVPRVFKGWWTGMNMTGTKVIDEYNNPINNAKVLDDDHRLYAGWEEAYMAVRYQSRTEICYIQYFFTGDPLIYDPPTPDNGKIDSRWFSHNIDGDIVYYNGWYSAPWSQGTKIEYNTPLIQTDSHIVYIGWDSCSIKFIVDNYAYATIVQTPNDYFKLPSSPVKVGYKFKGWAYKKDDTLCYVTNTNKFILSEIPSEELYAQWDPISYNIIFNPNGGSGLMENMVIFYDAEATLFQNKYQKNGYYFDSWNTKLDGSGQAYGDQETIQNLTSVNNASITLYAQWKPFQLHITYHSNGAKANDDYCFPYTPDITYIYGQSLQLMGAKNPFNLQKDGYHIDTNQEWITSDNQIFSDKITYAVTTLAPNIINQHVNLDLYANWDINTINIYSQDKQWHKYAVYIFDNTKQWRRYVPFIYNGETWIPYN